MGGRNGRHAVTLYGSLQFVGSTMQLLTFRVQL